MKRSVPRLHGAAKAVARGELVGLQCCVAASNDAGLVGLEGAVVDETLKTVTVRRADGRTVRIAKAGSTFRFSGPDRDAVEIEGRAIEFRPEDRTKKVR